MIKRLIDILCSAIGLCLLAPLLAITALLVWIQDFGSPFYRAYRIGKGERQFRMLKFRTMILNADRTGVTSTAGDDPRITTIGRAIRRFKLDELTQLWNVLLGDMSLVGPRPNVPSGVDKYSEEERKLLCVRPGITDFASIIFSDEAEILRGYTDPDRAYDELIRPWKSRLGLWYIRNRSLSVDMNLILLTVGSLFSRRWALDRLVGVLQRQKAPPDLIEVAARTKPLKRRASTVGT